MTVSSEIVDTLKDFFKAQRSFDLVVLFGSHAMGKARRDSDVDIAIHGKKPLDGEERLTLASELEEALKAPVDVVDLAQAKGMILSQILTKGKIIVNNRPPVLERLMKQLVYDEADFMPLYRRTLKERVQRFIDGH